MHSSVQFIELLPRGVLLEDRDLLLPWGATRQELEALDPRCETIETRDRWELVWPDCTVLNGVRLRLSAVFYDIPGDEHVFLHRLSCEHMNDGMVETARRKYDELKDHVTLCCGPPLRGDHERSVWEVSGASIGIHIWDHFGFFCALVFGKR